MGTDFLLKYPSVDSIIRTLNKLGPAYSIFKIDISRAFRHIRIDPGDLDLLGLQHLDQYYLDLSLPFGYRLGSIFFQKLSDSIRYIMNKNGLPGLHKYLDDLIYCGLPSEVQKPYQFLTSLLQDLGLAISQKKLVPCLFLQKKCRISEIFVLYGRIRELSLSPNSNPYLVPYFMLLNV